MQIYFGVTIDKEASIEIAGRSRGTPRIANRLLKRVADYATVLNNSNISEEIANLALGKLEIDKIGLDNIDRKILNTIIVGIEALATTLRRRKRYNRRCI